MTNGGSASDTIVKSGGVLKVSGETVETAPVYPEPVIRSVATGATVEYQGEFDVTGGGTTENAIVHGGVMTVSGSIPDPFANVPGQPSVDASMAIGTTIENGGTLTVSNGALASGTTLQIFATLNVDAGGTATGTTINLGTMQLSAGATATNTTVNQGGVFIVLGNASFSGTVFNAGSTFEIGGGTVENGFTVQNGVTLTVLDGGVLENSVVTAGGTLMLEGGATFSKTTFQSGATLVVDFDYAVDGFTVADGITYKVIGTATNTTILADGKQIVGQFGEGGSATNTVINGGEQDVELLATASYTTINMGGIQHVAGLYIHDEPGPGRADHTTINNGGEQDVDTGIVSSTTVNAGGVQNLTNGGIASGTIVKSGGVINASGETVYYSPGGYFATVIRSKFDSADVESGGQLHLTGAGIAKNATIDGGVMTVSGSIPDPVTNDPSLPPDPSAPAVDASEATGTILNSGSVSVSDGGIVTSTTLNGGTLDVLDQGTANASTIHHGATELVEAGGIVGATTIAGGTLDLKAGAIADDVISFAGQGILKIEQKLVSGPSTFASQIDGILLGDQIDLTGLSYSSGATATVSGSTLTVSNGTASETFTLADTSVTHFGITKDGAGGILLTADTHPTGPTTINGPASGYAIIEGTTGDDIIHAYGMFNVIHGNGGNDAIYAGLYGTVDVPSGDSIVHLQGFDNHVTGGDGNVTVTGATGATMIALGNGNDTIDASGYGNIITLGNGKNIVHPGDGASTITAGNGNDQVTLSGFGNKVVLGNGDDVVTGGGGANNVTLGDGDNTVDLGGMANQITVGSGTNTIIAGNGLDPATDWIASLPARATIPSRSAGSPIT
ncbi:AIDA repeat-containing protein [Bradyrhizobium sp. CCBAU 51745]|uniref:AIDA repeat-containing protein n=1 Tax=Bradyrhizobium sp. CCBAU 51745 TaxID=1325099 RepID=UPI002306B13D|nr:AIDA repeat-containing protein [Bradyrhizobium sp. CCBAU 51745]